MKLKPKLVLSYPTLEILLGPLVHDHVIYIFNLV
jgi:hypothetical protein